MTWLTWRQFRTQAVVATVGLAALIVVAILAGLHLSHLYADAGLAGCTNNCAALNENFLNQVKGGASARLMQYAVGAVHVIPVVIGVFWGAPLIARELESGTYRLAWNQSVTRGRWLAIKLAGVGLASVLVVGLGSLAVTWWQSPYDRASLDRLSTGVFGAHGIVPMGYAAFAFAVGVTAGLLLRRTVPAMAVTLVVVTAALIIMPTFVRAHLMTPVSLTGVVDANNLEEISMTGNGQHMTVLGSVDVPGAWVVSNRSVTADGHTFTGPVDTTACNRDVDSPRTCIDWIASLHLRQAATYQPASRFWALQWRETAIFAGAALLLCGFCFWWVHRRVT